MVGEGEVNETRRCLLESVCGLYVRRVSECNSAMSGRAGAHAATRCTTYDACASCSKNDHRSPISERLRSRAVAPQ
eukprot:scaffold21690_cov123-Isochrysis_galbana.AAC.2